jgi:hypothetical protein
MLVIPKVAFVCLQCLHWESVANVVEVHPAFIIRVSLCRVDGFLCISNVSREPWRGIFEAGALFGPIKTVDSESCVKGNNQPFQSSWSAEKTITK